MASTLPKLPVFEAIANHDCKSTAVIHCASGRRFTYGQLLKDVADGRNKLLQSAAGAKMDGQRIALLIENSYDYVGATRVTVREERVRWLMSYSNTAIDPRETFMLLSSAKFQSKAEEVLKEGLDKTPILSTVKKTLAGILTAQSRSLMQAWKYTPKDHLLHVLPLHHIHGTVNALLTPLFAGSTIEFLFPFNVQAVWERLAAPFAADTSKQKEKITFLTVVPTIYNRLLSSHPDLDEPLQKATKEALLPTNLRLNISGSAALPTPTKSAWTELSGGNILLERYGMTEVGMALSCGLDFADRVDASVGWSLPFVEARLVDPETKEVIEIGEEITTDGKEREGEIQLRGPSVFKEYWRNLQATADEFVDDEDGKGKWFKTGDVATRRVVEGAGKSGQDWARGPMYFIRGRQSVDIIKSGGEKWGQKVAAIVVLHPDHAQSGRGGKTWGIMDMRRALKDRLANYKIPQELKVLQSIPKNAMGKVNKKSLVKEVFGNEA
ncbi:MAG: hypothetical protein Q9196_001146 [Gyalolechia fulgens]